jgi:hypothetical protein
MLKSFDGTRLFTYRPDPRPEHLRGPEGEQQGCDDRSYRDGEIPFSGEVNCDEQIDLAGDFNGDGRVDVGGPDNLIVATGVSLGGIVTAVAAAAEPDIQRAAPIAGGGGLSDIGVRCLQPGVVEAIFLKLFGPLIVGVPYAPVDCEPVVFDDPETRKVFHTRYRIDQVRGIWEADDPEHLGQDYGTGVIVKDRMVTLQSPPRAGVDLLIDYDAVAQPEEGSIPPGQILLRIEYDLNNVNRESRLTIADRVDLQEDDLVRLSNLDNLEQQTVRAGPYGRFRVAVPSDSEENLNSQNAEVRRQALLASDKLVIELLDPLGNLKRRIDSFSEDVDWHSTPLRAGDPLVGLVAGYALSRNTPDLRRFMQLSQIMLEPADPANWVSRAGDRLLLILTVGDMNVPINTGIAMARAAGMLRFDPGSPDPVPGQFRRPDGLPEHQVLFDWWVHEGLEKLDRFPAHPGRLADPDDLDDNNDGFDAPSPAVPLRATRYDSSSRPVSGVRFPYLRPEGQHGFRVPAPYKDFDIDSYMINQMGRFFRDGIVEDDPCLEDYSCDFIPREFIPLD